MRSSLAATTGLPLTRTPSARQQAARRRWAVLAAVVGLAGASWTFGALTARHSEGPVQNTGPFSYFPSE